MRCTKDGLAPAAFRRSRSANPSCLKNSGLSERMRGIAASLRPRPGALAARLAIVIVDWQLTLREPRPFIPLNGAVAHDLHGILADGHGAVAAEVERPDAGDHHLPAPRAQPHTDIGVLAGEPG